MLVRPNEERAAYLDNQFEADLLRQALRDEGIPALIESNTTTAYGDLFQASDGWGAVYAEPKHHARIQSLLQEIRDAAAASPSADEEG